MAGDESPFFQELPTVLTPSRMPQSIRQAPAAVTVIDRDDIEARGYRDIPRLLRGVPGMQVGQERGGAFWVTYHGLGNDFPSEMQVLVDGRSVYSPSAFGGVDWASLPVSVDEIDRIEVVRGTDSSAYGSNALLGVISIFTRDPSSMPIVRVAGGAGTEGIRDGHATIRLGNSAAGWALHAAHQQDHGFTGLHDDTRIDRASLRGEFRRGDREDLQVRIAGSHVVQQLGYADSLLGNNAEREARKRNLAFDAAWRFRPDPREEWTVRAFHNRDRVAESWLASALRTDLVPSRLALVPLDRNREALRSDLEFQNRREFGATMSMLWGAGTRHDEIDAPFLFFDAGHRDQNLHRAFANLEWRTAPAWTWNAGTVAERYSGDTTRWSPRLHANWQVDRHHTLRAGVARAWRQRNLFEVHGDIRAIDPLDGVTLVRPFVPNPGLRPTRVDSAEVSYLGALPAIGLSLDVRAFSERLTDYVVRERVASTGLELLPSSRYTNLASPLTLRGIEFELGWQPRPATTLAWSQALIHPHGNDDSQARRTAERSGSLTWRERWNTRLSSIASIHAMSPVAGGDGFVPGFEYQTPGYAALDIALAWRTRLAEQPCTLRLVGTNLGGRHQEIPDRSEQALHPNSPVNPVSKAIHLTLEFESP
jgi:iron complex outermembrane receptor protein